MKGDIDTQIASRAEVEGFFSYYVDVGSPKKNWSRVSAYNLVCRYAVSVAYLTIQVFVSPDKAGPTCLISMYKGRS
jgi:hypothetical protein